LKSLLPQFSRFVSGLLTVNQQTRSEIKTPLYRNALFLIFNNLAGPALGFVFWWLVARLYTESEAGLATSTISAMNLIVLFTNLGLGFGLIRLLAGAGNAANRLVSTSLSIVIMISAAVGLVFLAGLRWWSPELAFLNQQWLTAGSFFLVCVVASAAAAITQQVFIANRQAAFVPVLDATFSILRFPLLFVFGYWVGSQSVLMAWTVAMAMAVILGVFLLLPKAQSQYRFRIIIDRELAKQILPFSLVNHLSNLFWTAPGSILPLIVLNVLGPDFGAYLFYVWSIASILMMIPLATSLSLFAEGSFDATNLARDVRRALILTLSIVIPATIVTLLAAPFILSIYGGSYVQNGTGLLRILALAAIPTSVNYIILSVLRVTKRLLYLTLCSAFTMSATLIGSYLWLPTAGINGIGYAYIISQSVVTVIFVFFWVMNKKAFRKSFV